MFEVLPFGTSQPKFCMYEGWLKNFKTDFFLFGIRWLYRPYNFFLFQSSVLHVEYICLQRFINNSNAWNRLFCDVPFSTAAVAFLTSSSEENLFPRSCLLSVGNAQKSHCAKSGLYGEYFSAVPPISVSAANATAAICGRELQFWWLLIVCKVVQLQVVF